VAVTWQIATKAILLLNRANATFVAQLAFLLDDLKSSMLEKRY
jgi:hypothetical protein